MTYEQRCAYYRANVDKALAAAMKHIREFRDAEGSILDDDTICMIAIRTELRSLADEAEARINIEAQVRSILDA